MINGFGIALMFLIVAIAPAIAQMPTDSVPSLDAPSWEQGGASHALANPGDGIFTPKLAVIAIDKTGRPFTAEAPQSEPRFAALMTAGKSTGNSYVIKFPTGEAGGDCAFTGAGRYFIESTGVLTFQIVTACGKLKRGYDFMVCALDENLRCREAPWWYFRDRTYAISDQGVAANGILYPWSDAAQAPQQLQKIAAGIKAMRDRFSNPNAPNIVHMRFVSCRFYHPETKSYEVHEASVTCTVKSMCNNMPNTDGLRDGDPIDWSSPVGAFTKTQNKISDVSNWSCWLRTQ